MNELLTMEGQDDCAIPNSVLCRIEWDKPLPVELSSFTSSINGNNVTLNWTSIERNEQCKIRRKNGRRRMAYIEPVVERHYQQSEQLYIC